jgi:hypothetical protein
MIGNPEYQIDQTNHPIYQKIGDKVWNRVRFAKRKGDGVTEEFHFILDKTVNDLLQKFALLYDASMDSPRAFQIISARHIEGGVDKAVEFIIKNFKEKENLDDLTRKYVEAYSPAVVKDQQYQDQYGNAFITAIKSITITCSTFIEDSVQKKLTPKKTVTWKEEQEIVRIP